MKINSYQPPNSVAQTDSTRSQGVKSAEKKSEGMASQQDVVTHINHLSSNSAQDIDMARVTEIREAIRDGKLTVDTDRISSELLKQLGEGL